MQKFFLSIKESRIEPTSPKTYYGCFYLGPFENGQALTVANALRRTLLSQISGVSISAVKVNKVVQEYSSLEGVRETVLDILLNLKEIVITRLTNKPLRHTQLGYLQVQGPGIVRASDLKLPPTLKCVDPEQYIATLNHNGSLHLKVKVDEGLNYRHSNEIYETKNNTKIEQVFQTDFLSLDSVFTPIKKVNYTIESCGGESLQKSNQVLILEVWTNGSVLPKDSIYQALNYLRSLFTGLGQLKILEAIVTTNSLIDNENFQQIFGEFEQTLQNINLSSKSKKIGSNYFKEPTLNDFLDKYVKDLEILNLGLPFQISYLLYNANIRTIGQLLKMNVLELKKIEGFGDQSLRILKHILKSKKLNLEETT
jgi:DNA-directed RNA polymerase subunit alpha